ncbi:hypothetical protein [Jatrophihabitans sp.]|uniref:CIS tube protein n=1 Tax=Jatrophihabitans sp. TaxID=1932789 RepID=UPI002C2774F2|nr:hypothetical protein [Jatrophihabitans sp.]
MTAPEEKPAKAKLYKLTETPTGSADKPPKVSVSGPAIPVQFNPTSLKLDRTNDTSGGTTTRAQRRNRPNEGHVTLTLELEFDTAEGGPDGQPLDVRTKTADVRQFAEPPKDKPKGAPPRIRFEWGTFRFDGIVTRLGEEIDYFSSDGLPLRAKLSLTITGQDAMFESNASGPGSRDDQASTPPGGGSGGAGPNSGPTRNPTQAVPAQDGESMQQLLSRLNADPAGWRSAMAGLNSPLGLSAGFQVQLAASASVSAGIGVSAGFAAGLSADAGFSAGAGISAGAGFSAGAGLSAGAGISAGGGISAGAGLAAGLSAGAGLSTGAGASAGAVAGGAIGFAAEADAGFALSAGGGVAAVVGRTLSRQADLAVSSARGSFDVPGGAGSAGFSATASAGANASAGAGVSATASVTASAPAGVAASFPVSAVDRRAVSYGYGVPLRPRLLPAAGVPTGRRRP